MYHSCCWLQAKSDQEWQRFMNHDKMLQCLLDRARGPTNDAGEASRGWVDGWDSAPDLITVHTHAVMNTSRDTTLIAAPAA